MISESHGNTFVHSLHCQTIGGVGDILEAGAGRLGFKYKAVHLTAGRWRELIAEMGGTEGGGKILHLAYSKGGITTDVALTMMSPAERNMIHVITFGTGRIISNREAGSAINYAKRGDLIPMSDIARYSHLNPDLVFLPGIGHTFSAPQYQGALGKHGEFFTREYGVVSP